MSLEVQSKIDEVLALYTKISSQEQPEQEQLDALEIPIKQLKELLMKKPVVAIEETKEDSQVVEGVLIAAEKLSLAIVAKTELTKELTKKANVNRANVRRTIREIEEKEEKVDQSFHTNLKKIEAEIAVLKAEGPRISTLLDVAL